MPLFSAKSDSILFYHIPKTGGTTIESVYALGDIPLFSKKGRDYFVISGQHLDVEQLSEFGLTNLASKSFCIVRDPLDRLISEYFHRTKEVKFFGRFVTFSTFVYLVDLLVKYLPRVWDNHLLPQVRFIDSQTKVYKFEDGFQKICESIEVDFGLEKLSDLSIRNKGDRKELNLTKDVVSRVYKIYSQDYQTFGYQESVLSNICSKKIILKERFASYFFFSVFFLYRVFSGKGISSLK